MNIEKRFLFCNNEIHWNKFLDVSTSTNAFVKLSDLYHCKRPDNLHFGNITFMDEDDDCKPRSFEWKAKRDGDEGSRYKVGCGISYGCREGYLLKGESTGRCRMTGDWGERPTCKKGT